MISPGEWRFLPGIPARLIALVLGGALWISLQWFFSAVIPESGIVFLRGGVVSFLSAAPLLAAATFFPTTRCGLWRIRCRLDSLTVTAVLLLPFVVFAMTGELTWIYPGYSWWATAFVLLLLAAAEEMVFRGFLLNVLSFRDRFLFAAAVSSVLFAAVHVDNYGATPLGILNVTLFGCMLAMLRLMSHGLIVPVIVHWAWNFTTGMVFGWRVSGYELPSLWSTADGGPWGTFGPEGSLLLTVSLAVGIVSAIYLERRHSLRA